MVVIVLAVLVAKAATAGIPTVLAGVAEFVSRSPLKRAMVLQTEGLMSPVRGRNGTGCISEEVKMQKRVLVLTTSASILACSAIAASAQQGPMTQHQPQMQQQQEQEHQLHHPDSVRGMGMMGQGGMMGMMGRRGMMGSGSMHSGMMMRVLFAMMDSDGDGTVSLQEFQTAHERIFRAMDTNKDGVLTLEEIQDFMQGSMTPGPRQ